MATAALGAGATSAQAAGITGYQVVTGPVTAIAAAGDPGANANATASCPTGKVALSGGVVAHNPLTLVNSTRPTNSDDGWRVVMTNTASVADSFQPYAVCADAASVPGIHVVAGSTGTTAAHSEGQGGAACSSGELPVGGGVTQQRNAAFVRVSRPQDGSFTYWEIIVENRTNQTSSTTPVAVCVPKADFDTYSIGVEPTSYTYGQLDQPVSGSSALTNTGGTPYCASGTVAVGAGVENHSPTGLLSSIAPAPGDPHYWLVTSTILSPPSGYTEFFQPIGICVTGVSDSTAPGLTSSAATNGGTGPVTIGGTDYYRGQVLVTLHGTDAGSGIARFDCLIDGSQTRTFIPGQSINGGGPPNVPGSPGSSDVQFAFDFNTEGLRTYSCTATDVAGNTSAATTGSFVIDDTAPVTTATTTPSSGVGLVSVTVDLSATDPSVGSGSTAHAGSGVASIAYSRDGGAFTTVSGSSASTSFTTAGKHTVQYRATDNVGNVETTKTITVYVDRTPPAAPQVNQYFVPVGPTYSGIMSGTAHDNVGVAKVEVRLDDAIGTITYSHTFLASCTGCGSPGTTNVSWSVDFSGQLPARGNYIATITVTDLAGNTRTVGSAAIVVQV